MPNKRDIKPGDLLFFRPTGWVGRLICWITRSNHCHVGLAERVGGDVWIAEYRERGFRFLPLDEAEEEWGCEADVYRYHGLTAMQVERILYKFKNGPTKYGFWHLIKTGLLRMLPVWLGSFLVGKECTRHAPHCSEAVCGAFRWAVDVDLVPPMPDWHTAPGDIIKSGKVTKV